MKNLNEEQVVFIRSLLEDELCKMLDKRSKSKSVKEYDKVCGERIKYIRDLIVELD